MKSKQNLSVLAWHRASKPRKSDGKAPIYLRITIDGLIEEISTGYMVKAAYWDSATKTCSIEEADAIEINTFLKEAQEEIKILFRMLVKAHETVTTSMLKNAYLGFDLVPPPHPAEESERHTMLETTHLFIANFQDMVDEGIRSKETLKQWRSTLAKIKEFAFYQYEKADISLEFLDEEFGDDLYNYLTVKRRKFLSSPETKKRIIELDTAEEKDKIAFRKKEVTNLQEAAARKQLKNVKQLLELARKKKWIPSNLLEDFKTSGGDKDVIPLEMPEVLAIYQKDTSIERLEMVRDCFIVQCFTGFAFQEIYNLAPENIVLVGENAEPWLIRQRGKTKVDEMVPILPVVAALIEKYQNHPYCLANDRLFPVNSNSKYNAYLKELGDICGIQRPLKTHLARHTFADIMLNICNVPLEDVSKMLGHKSIKTTMRYCKVRKIRISRNMVIAKAQLFSTDGGLKKIA